MFLRSPSGFTDIKIADVFHYPYEFQSLSGEEGIPCNYEKIPLIFFKEDGGSENIKK